MVDVRLGNAVDGPVGGPDVVAVCLDADGLLLDRKTVAPVPTGVLPLASLEVLRRFDPDPADGRAGGIRELIRPGEVPGVLLIVGVGDGSPRSARLAGAAIARAKVGPSIACVLAGLDDAAAAAFTEGLRLASYRFGSAPKSAPGLTDAAVLGAGTPAGLAAAAIDSDACRWARDLTNTRTNTKTPAWLGAQADAGLTPYGVKVTVRDDDWLRRNGFGGVIGVGQGSSSPPRLIEAAWRPRGAAAAPHVVLVGKGITFDTGGYNLKPGQSMTAMFTDMAGGAAVLGALRIVAARQLPIRVTALVPAAENSVSGSAMRPGDVLRHYNGRTSEINNTDAEGRLVLADALAYAAARLRPTVMVDIATLTGAMKVALGEQIAGLITEDDELAAQLAAAADDVDEPLWRMPLEREYEKLLDSSVADATNAPGPPGGITAALFLRHFVGDVPWAHLDIAGPARAGKATGFVTEGATGFGARLLGRWIERLV